MEKPHADRQESLKERKRSEGQQVSQSKRSKKRGRQILDEQLDNVKDIDKFGSPILFTTNGAAESKTWPGAIATILISLLALTFGYFKFLALYSYTDSTIATVNHLFDLPVDFEYSDFMIAWTVTNRQFQKDVLPASIGRLAIYYWQVDNANGKYGSREIPLRSCTAEDLSKFHKPHR